MTSRFLRFGCLLSAATFLSLSAAPGPVAAQTAVADCDRLAASPLDSTRPTNIAGVELSEIDTASAMAACTAAYEADASDPRLSYQLGRVRLQSGDLAEAESYFLQAAVAGHALAMANLGALMEETAPQDAFTWYKESAYLGQVLGQYNLAASYHYGIGTTPDAAKAIEFYTLAINQGDAVAPYNLAVLYDEGTLLPRDVTNAVAFYRIAVSRGNVDAMINLAFILETGEGVPADKEAALALFEQAASLGDADGAKEAERLRK